jgi:hypothetical protein
MPTTTQPAVGARPERPCGEEVVAAGTLVVLTTLRICRFDGESGTTTLAGRRSRKS